MSFKAGDRVVVVHGINMANHPDWTSTYPHGSCHIIREVRGKMLFTYSHEFYRLGYTVGYPYQVVPEALYNSRLYKALQEDT